MKIEGFVFIKEINNVKVKVKVMKEIVVVKDSVEDFVFKRAKVIKVLNVKDVGHKALKEDCENSVAINVKKDSLGINKSHITKAV